jgi:galactonate dehydratase
VNRRTLLAAAPAAGLAGSLRAKSAGRVNSFELLPVRATERTAWLFVRLTTDSGLSGIGEASDAFGFASTSKENAQRMESELRRFFELINGQSPLKIALYRQKGWEAARAGRLVSATAFSAIEQALWDLAGQSLEVPTHTLFGGAVRSTLPVYANINRATRPRTPAGFAAAAKKAVAEGFRSLKAAPWDGFPKPGSPISEIRAAVDLGVECVAAMREAVGPDIAIMVDCHSFFDVDLAKDVAQRLEPHNLAWYEEPVPPGRTAETADIRRAIKQQMAGGEVLFGVAGFSALARAVDVIMPDVKHCGGMLELTHIAAMADAAGCAVSPHNPSGPVSTAASVQVCAGMKNFRILEMQWGEVEWRGELLTPHEQFRQGAIRVPETPGFGARLNDKLVRAHLL